MLIGSKDRIVRFFLFVVGPGHEKVRLLEETSQSLDGMNIAVNIDSTMFIHDAVADEIYT